MQITLPNMRTPQWVVLAALLFPWISYAQTADSTLQAATLERVVQYALEHQPAVKQAKLDEKITHKAIQGRLADWYPQVNLALNLQHYTDIAPNIVGEDSVVRFGAFNTSYAQINVTQNIFNRDALLASKTASKVRIQSGQNTVRNKIDVVVLVTKAFYDVLATSQQIKVSEESIVRLKRSLKDALSRYNAGIADKTDYKRATILLSNAQTALKSNVEMLKYKEKYLKTIMGYPADGDLAVQYDTLQMENEIILDTLQQIKYSEHIDYKILYTQKELQRANVQYSYWAFLPAINAFGFFNYNYINNNFSKLYDNRYPFGYFGASLTMPLFQGGKRIVKIQEQKYSSQRLDVSLTNLENTLSTEYTRALSSYKSNLINYLAQKENVNLAKEVFDVIELQYRNGVRTYLDVTIAESDLRTTRINYFNALYSVLASKIDVQRSLSQIAY